MKCRPVYIYDKDIINQLFKLDVNPIGAGINPATGNFYVVFNGNHYFYQKYDQLKNENEDKQKNNIL